MAGTGSDHRACWRLDPDVVFLNHGSFGACPCAVLEVQQALRDVMEADPVHFFLRELEPRLDSARAALATFLGARADDLAFVTNTTTGVNAVLRSLSFAPGDELLVTDQAYNACANAVRYAAERSGARVLVVPLPFPLAGPDAVVDAVLAGVTPRTRLALLDHVTSPTGLVLPIERLVPALAARGVDALIDGAHAAGMLALDLDSLGAAYYTGNCHKWVCAPKGAGFLHVRRDRQAAIRPVAISHGFNSPRTDRSRFRLEFDWTGTMDPTPYLCVPEAIRYLGSLIGGGWPAVRARNRGLALEARRLVADALDVALPCPDAMVESLVALPLPDGSPPPPGALDPLQERLFTEDRIEVPVFPWPAPPRRLVRFSVQLYNGRTDYERLARALARLVLLPGPAGQ